MSNPQGERGCHLGARTAGEIPFHACFRLPLTLHGHKAMDEAAETTSSPSPAHGTGTHAAGSASHSAGSLRHHHVAHSHQPTRPGHPRTWPLSRKAQTLLETGPLANVGSAVHGAVRGTLGVLAGTRVCVRGLESLSPGMSGSHVFQIQAHFSEVISGKMLTLITAIKGNTASANINVYLEHA